MFDKMKRMIAVLLMAAMLICGAPAAMEETVIPDAVPEISIPEEDVVELIPAMSEEPDSESETGLPSPAEEIIAEETAVPASTAEPTAEPAAEPTPEPTAEPTPAPVPSILLDEEKLVLGAGEKYALNVSFDDGGDYDLRFYTADERIAEISRSGVVTARRGGDTKLAVESEFGERIVLQLKVKSAPSYVTIDKKSASIGAGQTLQLTASLSKNSAGSIKWSSSDREIAVVDQNGLVTALAKGKVTIKAETFNGRFGKVSITVKAAPESISLNYTEASLRAGETGKLKAEAPEGSYAFHSENPEIASVDAEGKVTAIAPGTAIIYAETYNGLRAECTVTVSPAPTGVSFQEDKITICAGDSYTLLPILLEGAEDAEFTISSSHRRVSVKGMTLNAAYAGSAVITVKTYNGLKDTVDVEVIAAPKSIAFREKEITLYMGLSETPGLKPECSFIMQSSDENVAVIDGGSIRAVGPGSATITAKTYNKATAKMTVHVPALPDHVNLTQESMLLGCGDSFRLEAVLPEGSGSALIYESSDPSVASVDEYGNVTAVAPGSAAVSVRTLNGCSDSCEITVFAAPTAVKLHPEVVVRSLDEGPFKLDIRFGAEDEDGRYSILSSNPDAATVKMDGSVTPIGPGETTITIETYNGLRAECRVTLGEKPGAIFFPKAEYAVALGDSMLLEACFDRGCESYSLTAGDSSVISVDGNRISGLAMGESTLTAVSTSGLSAECTVRVVAPPTGIRLSRSEEKLVLGVSPELQLSASSLPDGVGSVRYISSDPAIAEVDENGLVTAVSMGDCTIIASTYDGMHSAECVIHVRGVLDGVKVGIDPGHQSKPDYRTEPIAPGSSRRKKRTSSGTVGVVTNTPEHRVNLQIGLKLRDALEAAGAEVYMTRESANVTISNIERAEMMNAYGCDVVLRIHCNGSSSRRTKGMSIYVRQTGEKKAESRLAAQCVLKGMLEETGAINRGVIESDTYTGLNWSTVPSMLMEVGYLTNPDEDRLLTSDDYQHKLVAGMVKGVCAYMGRPAPGES